MFLKKIASFLTIFALIITSTMIVNAAPIVYIQTFGGDNKGAPPGFTIIVNSIEVNDKVEIEVSKSGKLIETFSETVDRPVLDRSFYFSAPIVSGEHQFVVKVNSSIVHTNKYRIYLGNGATDNLNQARLGGVFNKTPYYVGETAQLTLTVVGIEPNARGEANFEVKGTGLPLTTGKGTISGETVTGIVYMKITDQNMTKVDAKASWGARGYTASAVIPISIGVPPPVEASLTVNAEEGGTATGSGNYHEGDRVNIKATPNPGYIFDEWEVISEHPGIISDIKKATNTIVIPTTDVTILAKFKPDRENPPKYTIAVKPSSSEYGVTTGSGSYIEGQVVPITATPKEGYIFDMWELPDGGTLVDAKKSDTNYTVPAHNAEVIAKFKEADKVDVNVITDGNGTATGSGKYAIGSSIDLTATPKEGYKFRKWEVAIGDPAGIDKSSEAKTNYKVPNKDSTLVATFEPLVTTSGKHQLSITSIGVGTVTSGGMYNSGDKINVSAIPGSGYKFDHWLVINNVGTILNSYSASTTFTMPNQNATLVAYFIDTKSHTSDDKLYKLTLKAGTGGAVNGGGNYAYGEEVWIEAYADKGYYFDGWVSDNGGYIDSRYSRFTYFTMPSNAVTVTARFIAEDDYNGNDGNYRLTLRSDTGGSIVQDTSGNYKKGARITLNARADVDYSFNKWISDEGGTFSNASALNTTFTMPGNSVTLTATWIKNEPNKYPLSVVAEPGATLTGSSGGSTAFEDKVSLNVAIQPGYKFDGWVSSNGGSFTNASTTATQFTMPDNSTTVTAKTSIVSNMLTVTNSGNGTSTGSGTYNANATVNLTASAKDGHKFKEWRITNGGGTLASTTSPVTTYVMPANPASITAIFEAEPVVSNSTPPEPTTEPVKVEPTTEPQREDKGAPLPKTGDFTPIVSALTGTSIIGGLICWLRNKKRKY